MTGRERGGSVRIAVLVVGEGVSPRQLARLAARLLKEHDYVVVLVPSGHPEYEEVLPRSERLFVAPHTGIAPPLVAYVVTSGVVSGILGIGGNKYSEASVAIHPVGKVHDALLAAVYAAVEDVTMARRVKLNARIEGVDKPPRYYDIYADKLFGYLRTRYVQKLEEFQPGIMAIILENLLTPFHIKRAEETRYELGKGLVTVLAEPGAFELRVSRDWQEVTGKRLSPTAEEMIHYFVVRLRDEGALQQVYYAAGRHRYFTLRTKPHAKVLKTWMRHIERASREAARILKEHGESAKT